MIKGGRVKIWNSAWKQDFIFFVLAATVPVLVACLVYDISPFTIAQPIQYTGDGIGVYKQAKMLLEGWIDGTNRMGAPFGANYAGFPVVLTHNFDLLFLFPLLWICHSNIIAAVNCQLLLTHALCGMFSFYVLRKLQVSNFLSFLGATTFASSTYLFIRSINHIELTACEFVPISVLLCIWIYEDDTFLKIQKGFFRNKKNLLGIVFLLLLAQNGLSYYPFFTCFLIFVTALIKFLESKKPYVFLRSLLSCGIIIISLALALIPFFYAKLAGTLPVESIYRNSVESEIYGFKLILLFLPFNGFGIPWLQDVVNNYRATGLFLNENTSSYLGIVGILGFIFLGLVLLGLKMKNLRMKFLSKLLLMAFLIGTVGGIGAIFSYFFTNALRAFNRITPFVLFICILAVCIIFSDIKPKKKHQKVLAIVLAVILFFGSIGEQIPFRNKYEQYEPIRQQYNSDREFIVRLESLLPKGSMIFQLPYHPYPEGGHVNNMGDYALTKGYLFSENLRWSYGAVRNSEADVWCSMVANMPLDAMISTLKKEGFVGIYVDSTAYLPEELDELTGALSALLGDVEKSSEGDLLFFALP